MEESGQLATTFHDHELDLGNLLVYEARGLPLATTFTEYVHWMCVFASVFLLQSIAATGRFLLLDCVVKFRAACPVFAWPILPGCGAFQRQYSSCS